MSNESNVALPANAVSDQNAELMKCVEQWKAEIGGHSAFREHSKDKPLTISQGGLHASFDKTEFKIKRAQQKSYSFLGCFQALDVTFQVDPGTSVRESGIDDVILDKFCALPANDAVKSFADVTPPDNEEMPFEFIVPIPAGDTTWDPMKTQASWPFLSSNVNVLAALKATWLCRQDQKKMQT